MSTRIRTPCTCGCGKAGAMSVFVRKGFTLVEVLIVITVMGILASMMMLSSSESVSSANASNIITNLMSWKQAALMLYTDSLDVFGNKTKALANPGKPVSADVVRYLSASQRRENLEGYDIDPVSGTFPCEWYVKYTGGMLSDSAVRQKLASRAGASGLQRGKGKDGDAALPYNGGTDGVWFRVR